MIRILFDNYKYADANKDIILKVDALPSFAQFSDSYYLQDFLCVEQKSRKEVFVCYLEYFKYKVLSLTEKESFIICDLSDQYIGGFFMSKGKKDIIKAQYAWTDKIEGYAINKDTINEKIKGNKADFKVERDWIMTKTSIIEGLIWSIKSIK